MGESAQSFGGGLEVDADVVQIATSLRGGAHHEDLRLVGRMMGERQAASRRTITIAPPFTNCRCHWRGRPLAWPASGGVQQLRCTEPVATRQ